ncbi:LacI family DNA-binding transcriptional regulator [Nocardioides marinquilinus]|uniref:LacI family DNA-binding transcriptional regulator n=1 Tax=Nocardioides marinquilinus TaxID=1210400 RepID=A0ABP9Q106_9ACTN
MARPTISDVARAAGVSKGAVSFALNDRPGVSADTRARVLDVARAMGWTPSAGARALSTSRAHAVGLVLARAPEVLRADSFFPAFIAGLETVLSGRDYALLLQVAERDDEPAYRRLAQQQRVDGVILTDLHVDDDRPRLLAELDLPAVLVGPRLDVPPSPRQVTLGADDGPAVRETVRHLVGLGHRVVAHVAGPADLVHGRSRRAAWEAALAEAGLRPGPVVEADFSAESGARATHHLLDLAPDERPTAIVYANDLMATAALAVAHERGVDVPGQLSVTGYDDTELAAHLRPALTTVRTDVVGWGRAAATRLLQLVDGDTGGGPAPAAPTARLVVRASTGPAPST